MAECCAYELFPDHDRAPAMMERDNVSAVVRRIDDGRSFGGKAREILACRQSGHVQVGWQERLQRDWGCALADAHKASGDLVEFLVDRLTEMPWFEKVR